MALEGTYGTAVTVSRFYEFVGETFDWSPTFVQGAGLRVASRVARAARRKLSKSAANGDLTLEPVSVGMGQIWNGALGVSTSTIIPSSTAFQQVHTPTKSDYLPSYTIQKGVPPLGGGTTLPHTFKGCTATGFDFTATNGGITMLKVTYDIKDYDTSTTYAAPSYPAAPELFTFVDGTITIGGTLTTPTTTALASVTGGVANDIVDFQLAWDNKCDTGGYNFGGAGKRTRSPAVGLASGTGKLTAEFDAVTLRDAYLNQTDLAVVMTFKSTVALTAGVFPTLQIVIPDVRLEGEIPKSNAGGVITQSIPYTVLDNTVASSALYVVSVTADTAL